MIAFPGVRAVRAVSLDGESVQVADSAKALTIRIQRDRVTDAIVILVYVGCYVSRVFLDGRHPRDVADAESIAREFLRALGVSSTSATVEVLTV